MVISVMGLIAVLLTLHAVKSACNAAADVLDDLNEELENEENF